MSENKHLNAEDSIAKLQHIVKNSPSCMFATRLGEAPFHVCPMQVQEADYDGLLWFFSGDGSAHNKHIYADPRVQLIFANNSDMEFLTVFGEAAISRDQAQIDRLWSRMAEAWFPGGKDDPKLTLICVRPTASHYWDTEDGKFVTMAKILTKAATGADIEVGEEGDLEL